MKVEEHDTMLLVGTSFAKQDEVWTSLHKGTQIYVFWQNIVSTTQNTSSYNLFKYASMTGSNEEE
jgi:hypothetical protein